VLSRSQIRPLLPLLTLHEVLQSICETLLSTTSLASKPTCFCLHMNASRGFIDLLQNLTAHLFDLFQCCQVRYGQCDHLVASMHNLLLFVEDRADVGHFTVTSRVEIDRLCPEHAEHQFMVARDLSSASICGHDVLGLIASCRNFLAVACDKAFHLCKGGIRIFFDFSLSHRDVRNRDGRSRSLELTGLESTASLSRRICLVHTVSIVLTLKGG
jgi:hypothetical protein